MKLSNSQILGIVGAVAIITYFVYRKKGLLVKDLKANKNAPTPKQPIVGIEVSELKKKGSTELQFTGGKQNIKSDLIIKPRNVIPDVYDRGIGDEVNFLGNMTGGGATINIDRACKCADKRQKLPLDLPKMRY
jgi:beta-lactamase regulating signal transducer with metallopeptidase domain